jgi:ABC-type transport system substrate-binding protein
MRRLTRIAAFVAAGVFVLSISVSEGPIRAAGPPLRYLAGPPETLDPAFIADAADVQLLLQLYAGLTRLDETGEPYPSLASGWQISDDGLTYEFAIRDDLEFSNGSPLVADDIRRSWLRLLDPEVGATAPDVLNVVAGATERLAGEATEDEVGIAAPDERTLVVTLRHPASYFLDIVATPATFVVPDTADATDTWQTAQAFIGSGPYIVESIAPDETVLRANERYVAGPPPIDEIRWLATLDGDGDAVQAFSDDAVDLAQVGGFDATWIAYDADLGPRLHAAEPLTISYFGFDTTRPPFDDERVRLAFALALERERLVPLSEGAAAEAAASLVPPAIWPEGFEPELDADPGRARELLDEAGYTDRADLGEIVVLGNGLDVEPAVSVWREELGVNVAVETMEFNNFLELLDTRPPQIFTINWIADYASPNAIYGLLLEPDALSNYGDWQDPEFVELLEAAAAAPEDEVGAAYDAVDARVAEQAPVIPWSYGETWWLVADGLRGLGNLTIGLLDFGRVSWDG